MRSWRLLAASVLIDDVAVEVTYADVYVVHREGEGAPGPNDWEATVHTAERQRLAPGTYTLAVDTVDDHRLSGHAVLRFSDGQRHLFRGDGHLAGVAAAIA
ncbi:MAG: hypothetical protein ACLGI8_15450 [Acidimicrobiia bacterium]|jgi:hypothetical protein